MRILLAALVLVPQEAAPKVDFSKYTQAREFRFVATKLVHTPDGKHLWSDKGCLKVADWTVLEEAKNINELVFSVEKKSIVAIGAVEGAGLALYTLPDWKAVTAAGVGGKFVACDISPDRKTILGCGPFTDAVCVVTLWDSTNPKREVLKGDEMVFGRFVDDKRFVTVGKKGGVHLWEAGKPAPVASASMGEETPGGRALSPDRKHVYVAGAAGFKKFSTADLKEMRATVVKMPPAPTVTISPKGRLVALYGGGACELYETATMTLHSVPLGRDVAVNTAAFSPDETFLLLGDATARKMYVVALADGSVAHEFETLAPPAALAIGPRGAWIVASTGTATYAWAPPKKKP